MFTGSKTWSVTIGTMTIISLKFSLRKDLKTTLGTSTFKNVLRPSMALLKRRCLACRPFTSQVVLMNSKMNHTMHVRDLVAVSFQNLKTRNGAVLHLLD